jgi:NAD(P)-dependent dehydrogenase (short-subunit alcohol dehydrogenase family)
MAIKFAALKAKLTISDINEEGLNETKRMIKEKTGSDDNVYVIKLDVSNRQMIAEVAKTAVQKNG